jgi:AcrR family transcriptional regulator
MTPRNANTGARQDERPGGEVLAPARVAEIQRQRLLSAMAAVAAERGAANVAVAHVVMRAGVSRRTFYELFADRDECFMAALEQAIGRARARVLPAYEEPGRWQERIRAGLGAALEFMDEEPVMARLCVVEALGGGPRALERRRELIAALIAVVDEGRAAQSGARAARPLPPLTAEGVVGAVLSILHARLLAGAKRSRPFTDLLGELMGVIVLPYLGQAAAQRELSRPTPPNPKQKSLPRGNPLEGLRMRLTYRTLRVLAEIAAHPGASNRQVAAAAEIADQGQMSKLLTRLEDLGLIENAGAGQARGARNAWTLTARGEQVGRAIESGTGG